jgi:tyrosine phenol-lyase
MQKSAYPFEPFRTKSIEPIRISTKLEREQIIKDANYNLFLVKAEDVMIDLLTDSGTGSMSANQNACLLTGDESYAGAKSFYNFEKSVRDITGFKRIYPVHQGRAAERILFSIICKKGSLVISNTLFDTTRGNIEFLGAVGIDIPTKEALNTSVSHPFKGNIDLEELSNALAKNHSKVAAVIITLTNNAGGGQPVSMENIKEARKICNAYKVMMIADSCRFAENAYFIKTREEGYAQKSIKVIAQEMFSYFDGSTMSAKKDAITHIGGWLAINDDAFANQIENLLILTEGYKTYGGLAGRDLDAIAVGLQEVVQEDYLKHRIESVAYLGNSLVGIGVPVVMPLGGHAVFVDAKKLLPHIDASSFPAQALAVELYIEGGIRGVEIGSFMFGKQPDGSEVPAKQELLRLALPRRTYNKGHFDYIVEIFAKILDKKNDLKGYKITQQAPNLRHFTAHLMPSMLKKDLIAKPL